MTVSPELRTERLRLRPFAESDAAFVLDLHSRWDVQRFIGREPRLMTDLTEAHERIERYRATADGIHGAWLVADAASGTPHGTLLLKPLPASAGVPDTHETEIGWHLHPDAWGRGIATEAASAVLAHAFACGLGRVLAVTHPDNTASQAVARRIGMVAEGLTDRYYDTVCALFRADADPVMRR